MIEFTQGDILQADVDAIVSTVNRVDAMVSPPNANGAAPAVLKILKADWKR